MVGRGGPLLVLLRRGWQGVPARRGSGHIDQLSKPVHFYTILPFGCLGIICESTFSELVGDFAQNFFLLLNKYTISSLLQMIELRDFMCLSR